MHTKREKESINELLSSANTLLRLIVAALYGAALAGLWLILWIGVPLLYYWLQSIF